MMDMKHNRTRRVPSSVISVTDAHGTLIEPGSMLRLSDRHGSIVLYLGLVVAAFERVRARHGKSKLHRHELAAALLFCDGRLETVNRSMLCGCEIVCYGFRT